MRWRSIESEIPVASEPVDRRQLWAFVAVLIGVRIGSDWPLADNHIYLLAYWCGPYHTALPAGRVPRTR